MTVISKTYKLAAVDLDGTLLDANTQISQDNFQAIKKLENNGLTIILASGRNAERIIEFQKELGLTAPIISNHGALVKNPATDETIFYRPLAKSTAKKVVNEAQKHGATVVYYHSRGIFALKENDWTDFFNIRSGTPLSIIDKFESLGDEDPYKIIWLHEPEVLSHIQHNFNSTFAQDLYIVRADAEHLEFISPHTNKAVGLEAVAQYLGIDRQAVISFGDADNDIPMLSWAALGIAMHHATEGAKKAADIISPPGNPATSFARAVDSLLL